MIKRLLITLFLISFCIQNFAQNANNLISKKLCDSVIITSSGEFNYKLIFEQRGNFLDRNSIVIGKQSQSNPSAKDWYTLISIGKKPMLFSCCEILGSKKFLNINYDTCLIYDYTERIFNNHKFTPFVTDSLINNLSEWKVEIGYLNTYSDNTNYNKVAISNGIYNIGFNCLYQIQAFEADLNKNNKTELYLFSYKYLESELKIYRIELGENPNIPSFD